MAAASDRTWLDVERDLAGVANDFSVFDHLSPVNEQEQRELFEAGEIENPDFEYPDPSYDPEVKAEKIEGVKVPEGAFETQFRLRLERQRMRNEVVRSRGNREDVVRASSRVYGLPADDLVAYAEEILEKYPERSRERTKSAEDVKAALEEAMALYETEYGEDVFGDWEIEIDESRTTTSASRKEQKFKVGTRDYLEGDPRRIVIHELGRHALLRENRRAQRQNGGRDGLREFVYESETEEGITTNLECITDTENPDILRKYALRALAVDSILGEDSFRETYSKLSEHDSDPELLWNTTLRVHRGGGFVKDHIYLQGRRRVRGYLDNGGILKPLYIGKVPLESVETAERMMGEDLEEPAYSPELLHDRISDFWE